MLKRTFLVFIFFFLIAACKTTDEKVNEFVVSYNDAAATFSNNIITHTSAKALPNHEIRIIFETTLRKNSINNAMYEKLLPTMTTQIVESGNTVPDLLKDGVKIHFAVLAFDDAEIAETTLDFKSYNSEKQKNAVKPQNASNPNIAPALQQILEMLNKNLPIEDKEAGTKIISIAVNEKSEIVYTHEIPVSLAKDLQGNDVKNLLKDEMMRDLNVQKMLPLLNRYGLTAIVYLYRDTNGKMVNKIKLTTNDFQ